MEEYKDPEKITESMKSALAKMYADEDMRSYLMHMVAVYNHNVLISARAGEIEKARDYTAKFDTMKKLLDNGKIMYTQAERLRSKPLSEQLQAEKI